MFNITTVVFDGPSPPHEYFRFFAQEPATAKSYVINKRLITVNITEGIKIYFILQGIFCKFSRMILVE